MFALAATSANESGRRTRCSARGDCSLIGFRFLLASDLPEAPLAAAFFIWASVFNLILTSVFWGAIADVFSNELGRRSSTPPASCRGS